MSIGEITSNRIGRRLALLLADLVDRDPDHWMGRLRALLDDPKYRSDYAHVWRALADAGPGAVAAVLTSPHDAAQPLKSDCPLFLDMPIHPFIREIVIEDTVAGWEPDEWTDLHRVLTEVDTVLDILATWDIESADVGRNIWSDADWNRPMLFVHLPDEHADLLTLRDIESTLESALASTASACFPTPRSTTDGPRPTRRSACVGPTRPSSERTPLRRREGRSRARLELPQGVCGTRSETELVPDLIRDRVFSRLTIMAGGPTAPASITVKAAP